MDDTTREAIQKLAEENGLDPEALEGALSLGDMPEGLQQAMGTVLGDVARFGDALDKLKKK